ncbi:MAG: FAD binding domain-containing protein, partial [Acidimicrobiales bacterium]
MAGDPRSQGVSREKSLYPSKFEYVRATSVDNALELLSQNEDAKLLAGGHSLIPLMKFRLASPSLLVD